MEYEVETKITQEEHFFLLTSHSTYINGSSVGEKLVKDGVTFDGLIWRICNKDGRLPELEGYEITNCHIEGSDLSHMNFKGANFQGTVFKNCVLRDANFRGAQMEGCSFINCSMLRVDFDGASLRGSQFENCDLRGISLEGTDFEGATFEKTNLDEILLNNGKGIFLFYN